jgi:HAMP domain-containing protein
MRRALLLLSLLVFAVTVSIGIYVALAVLEPLKELEKDADRLAKGDPSVRFRGLQRSHEIGQIARSLAEMQETLIQWSLKTRHATGVSHPSNDIVAAARKAWAVMGNELLNIKVLLGSEVRSIVGTFGGPAAGASPEELQFLHGTSGRPGLTETPLIMAPPQTNSSSFLAALVARHRT